MNCDYCNTSIDENGIRIKDSKGEEHKICVRCFRPDNLDLPASFEIVEARGDEMYKHVVNDPHGELW